jgi:hypothetical protein
LVQPLLALACAVVTVVSCDDRMQDLESHADLTAPSPRSGAPPDARPRGWDQSPFGVSGIRYDPGQEAAGDALIDSLARGAATGGWVRLAFYWNEIQRAAPWWPQIWYPHGFIEPVARFKKHGVKVYGSIEGSAYWATSYYRKDPNYFRHPPDNLDDWRKYVQAVVDSFPDVDAWGIWNEPNDTNFFKVPDGQDAALEYARLVSIAAPIIHAAGKPVVVGEIAWAPATLGKNKTDRDVRDWVARMMRHITVTFGQTVEILAVHHYGATVDNINVADVRVPLMYAENPDLPWSKWEVWLSEFANASGYNDDGPAADKDIEKQIVDMFAHLTGPSKRNPYWKKAFYYNLADTGGGRRNLVRNWEIARATNNPSLLRYRSPFAAYRQILATGGQSLRNR